MMSCRIRILVSTAICASVFAFGSIAFIAMPDLAFGAGGVSDGGGGTTNPNPAHPDWVAAGVWEYGARVLIPFLNYELANYQRLGAKEKASSPFAKLFSSPDTFF